LKNSEGKSFFTYLSLMLSIFIYLFNLLSLDDFSSITTLRTLVVLDFLLMYSIFFFDFFNFLTFAVLTYRYCKLNCLYLMSIGVDELC